MTNQELAQAFAETVKQELKWGTEFGINKRGLEVGHFPAYSTLFIDRYQPSPTPSIYKIRKLLKSFLEDNKVDQDRVGAEFSVWTGYVLVRFWKMVE